MNSLPPFAGYQSVRQSVLFRNPKPHVRSVHAYFPSLVAHSATHLGAALVLGEAFEAVNLHLVYFESEDGGQSWRRKSTITSPKPNSSTTGRITLLPNGRLLAIVTRHQRDPDDDGLTEGDTIRMRPMQIEIYESTDCGTNWSGPAIVATPSCLAAEGETAFEMCSPVVPLEDGTLLWPTSTWPAIGSELHVRRFRTGALVSRDQGKTWPQWMEIYPNDECIYWESKIIPLRDSRLLGVAWAHELESGRDRANRYVLGSVDGSQWATPCSTAILGQTLSAAELPDGRLLSVYRRMDKPGLYATVFRLEESRWINVEDRLLWSGGKRADGEPIREQFATLKFGAPTILTLPNRDLLIAFWAVVDGVSEIDLIHLRMEY